MGDAAAEERHERHEGVMAKHERQLGEMETKMATHENWITGGQFPERGAEARMSRMEAKIGQGWLTVLRYTLPALFSAGAVLVAAVLLRVIP